MRTMPWEIFGRNRYEEPGDCQKFEITNSILVCICSSLNVIMLNKWSLARHVARMGTFRNAYKKRICGNYLNGRRPL
jgi:hypothetical protein